MIELLLMQFSGLVMRAGSVLQVAEEFGAGKIGFVVLGIIVGPVLLLTIVGIIEFPKKSRVPELFLGAFVLLVGALVFGFAAIGVLLKFIVPQ